MSSCYVAQGCSSDVSALVNIKLVHREGNAVIRRHLESLPLETFDFRLNIVFKVIGILSQLLDPRNAASFR
ncbi:hypothetical protein Ahy_B08g093489 isoform J [Arachis hypogaea]|uniref:Uncharacterized protein n=1 Tax=Arachis hypogaea TaxID=3818 RepID=A0A444Y678_ARAHY|nr:hypothetical protein Ahy_B08g093489 isoform J [Arachis hypogaea]